MNNTQAIQLRRIMIMAGGTGGHVFPALAVADELIARGVDVHWMGTEKGIEAKLIPARGLPLHCIHIVGIRGKSLMQFIRGPLVIVKAIVQAKKILTALKPQVVLGFGGYASGPGAIAARLLGIPLIVHEQNARAGTTNKVLAKMARHVLCGFPHALSKSIFVGNPVRQAFYAQPLPSERFAKTQDQFNLLVMGGSLGAQVFNKIVPAALALLPQGASLRVVHQSGARTRLEAQAAYALLQQQRPEFSVELPEFIDDVATQMAVADLIICRAGALTVAELAAIGAAALLVPYPYAIDDHQTANARWLSDKCAALLCPEHELTAENLAKKITTLMADRPALLAMANCALERGDKTATVKVAEYCLEYLNV